MAEGNYLGKGVNDPAIRRMFERDALLASDWYQERLEVKQTRDVALWRRHIEALEKFKSSGGQLPSADPCEVDHRLALAKTKLEYLIAPAYRQELIGTIGADPFYGQ